jgi:citrate lyase beta subunit
MVRTIKRSLTAGDLRPIAAGLRRANAALARACPGDPGDRQPIQTYYTGAQFFHAGLAAELGAQALAALDQYAPDAASFAQALGLKPVDGDADAFAKAIRARVVAKLHREPVEDLRIDFEDGYGSRPDHEEDGHAQSTAEGVARGKAAGTLPPFVGIRIKPLSQELQARGLRTLDLFVSTLARVTKKKLVPNLFITIPKVMMPGHVTAVANVCNRLERRLGLKNGVLKLEIMIETPQSILAVDGSSALRALVAAGGGRVTGAHFGTYDYTALCGITAAWQHMRHDACDFAKHMMQVALAQSGVRLSDGSTNVMPVGSPEAVHRAWKQHAGDITHSLINGYYQGWDLHPAQLPTRYAAVFAFYASARPAATARLRKFVEKASQATLVGDVFDDAATGQALLNFFARGLSSGALTLAEALETGLTRDELQAKSFLKILESRKL